MIVDSSGRAEPAPSRTGGLPPKVFAALYWTLPSILLILVYMPGLKVYFLQDDFAWLGLHIDIYTREDFWRAMFAPMAQGTIRPLSERGFFLLFEKLFGVDPLPFRIWVFLNQIANLVLISSITWRLTKSRSAGFVAPILWIVNIGLVGPMSWSSSYNQIQCGFFLLLAFHFFLRFIETGKRKYEVAQWITFLAGFGSLELNVVYPALAACYALLCARRYLARTLPMFVASAVYYAIHSHFAPRQTSGAYLMHWDKSILATLWTYVTWAADVARLDTIGVVSPRLTMTGTVLILGALTAFVIWKLMHGEWLVLFFAGWFGIVIAPLLPLRDHVSDYYLTIPTIGLAMLGGWALAEAWEARPAVTVPATVVACLYLAVGVVVTHAGVKWQLVRSRMLRDVVQGAEAARQKHPKDIILLDGVSSMAFWAGISDAPFRVLGLYDIYLTPESEESIDKHPETADLSLFVLPEALTARALEKGIAVVYDASSVPIRNITSPYTKRLLARQNFKMPRRVQAGQPLFSDLLGSTWYNAEDGYRWMPKEATVRLGGPTSAKEHIYLSGFAPKVLFGNGPIHVKVTCDGDAAGGFTLTVDDGAFENAVPAPARCLGQNEVTIGISVDRAYIPPNDGRELALAFGTISIH